MTLSSILSTAKSKLFPPAHIPLSEFIKDHPIRFNYWLRPVNAMQSQLMVGAYLNAMKNNLKNGGYIFVKKSRAADVFRQLTELGAAYKAIHFKDMNEISTILDGNDPKELWIIVEDDRLPYETLAARFRIAEVALRNDMAPPLETPITPYSQEDQQKWLSRGLTLLMFIEMDYPSVKGFTVIQSQARSLKIACCRVSMESSHDHELNKVFGHPEHNQDELQSRRNNSIQIFGSGKKYKAEYSQRFKEILHYQAQSVNTQQGSPEYPEALTVNLNILDQESNLGISFGFDSLDAYVIDLER